MNSNWWVSLSDPVVVNTVLFIASEHTLWAGGLNRNIHLDIRVGHSTANVLLNTIC